VRPRRRGGLLFALAAAVVLSGGPFACSTANELSGPGGTCTVVTDCQEGLVCCNAGKAAAVCANTVTCLQPAGTDAKDASTPPTGDDGGGTPPTDATTNPPDAREPETGTGTTPEAAPPDTGTPPVLDSGSPAEDTGVPEEAAPPPPVVDSGSDAGSD
jgi:hypothetical protein